MVVNFANGDMVDHTAKRHAILAAVEALDEEVGRLLSAAERMGYSVLLTADHGNCEEMVDPLTGEPHTHSTRLTWFLALFWVKITGSCPAMVGW